MTTRQKLRPEDYFEAGFLTLPRLLDEFAAAEGIPLPGGARMVRKLQAQRMIPKPIGAGIDRRRRNVAFYPPGTLEKLREVYSSFRQDKELAGAFVLLLPPEQRMLLYIDALLRRTTLSRFQQTPEAIIEDAAQRGDPPPEGVPRETLIQLVSEMREKVLADPINEEELAGVAMRAPWMMRALWVGFPKLREQWREPEPMYAAWLLQFFKLVRDRLIQGDVQGAFDTLTRILPWADEAAASLEKRFGDVGRAAVTVERHQSAEAQKVED